MRAVVLPDAGADFECREVAEPSPGPGEILVRMEAVGLNPVDYKLAKNGWPDWDWPHVTGVDGAGTVAALGEGVTRWAEGDRVAFHLSMGGPGCFAEAACVAAHAASAIPDGVAATTAAALPCAGLTAWQMVHRKLPQPQGDETVLVHAGAGGVGGFAIQFCRRLGLRVVTTCSPANDQRVTDLGADAVIHYAEEDVTARLRELTDGRGADWILALVDRATTTVDLTERLAHNGHIACAVGRPDLDGLKPFTTVPSIHEIALSACHLAGDRRGQEDLARMGEELIALVAAGEIDPMVTEVLPFDAIPEGFRRLAERHVPGKLVATVG